MMWYLQIFDTEINTFLLVQANYKHKDREKYGKTDNPVNKRKIWWCLRLHTFYFCTPFISSTFLFYFFYVQQQEVK